MHDSRSDPFFSPRAPARWVRADVPQDGQEGCGDAAPGLGADGDLLLLSARALAPLTVDEHRGMALRGRPAAAAGSIRHDVQGRDRTAVRTREEWHEPST